MSRVQLVAARMVNVSYLLIPTDSPCHLALACSLGTGIMGVFFHGQFPWVMWGAG